MRILLCIFLSIFTLNVNAHESIENVVTVNGQGSIMQSPDVLRFTIVIQDKGQNSQSLSRNVNKKVDQIIDMLTDNDVKEKDIEAMSIDFRPWYERERQTSVQKGFVFTRNINVTLRDFERYPSILQQLFAMNTTRIEGFRYEINDPENAYRQALSRAMKDAHNRAKQLVASTNRKLGDVVNIVESTSYRPLGAASSRSNVAFSESSQYLPGSNTITASVKVSFSIN